MAELEMMGKGEIETEICPSVSRDSWRTVGTLRPRGEEVPPVLRICRIYADMISSKHRWVVTHVNGDAGEVDSAPIQTSSLTTPDDPG